MCQCWKSLCSEVNQMGMGEKCAALLLAWDSLQHLIRKHNNRVSEISLVRYVTHMRVRDRSAVVKRAWKCWNVSGKLHWNVMLQLLCSLEQMHGLVPQLLSNGAWHFRLGTSPCAHSVLLLSRALYDLHQNSSKNFVIIICIGQSLQALTIMNLPVW